MALLREPLADIKSLSQLEKEGVVQRFEFTLELAWNSLKDYLEHQGVVLEPRTPKNVVKQAFAAKIIRDGQLWIDMLDCRNQLSHTYDQARFDALLRQLVSRFLPAFDELSSFLKSRSAS